MDRQYSRKRGEEGGRGRERERDNMLERLLTSQLNHVGQTALFYVVA